MAPLFEQPSDRELWQDGDPDVRISAEQRDRMQTDSRELATDTAGPMDTGI